MPKRTLVEFAFLVLALAPLLHFGISPFLGTFSVVFASIVFEALPFVLVVSYKEADSFEQDSWVRVDRKSVV